MPAAQVLVTGCFNSKSICGGRHVSRNIMTNREVLLALGESSLHVLVYSMLAASPESLADQQNSRVDEKVRHVDIMLMLRFREDFSGEP